MQVILLEKIEKLGELGDAVRVKPGYARNYLLPQGKALRATEENLKKFEAEKAERLKANDSKRAEAEKLKDKIHEKHVIIIRAASEAGYLYGSVTARDVANAINESLKQSVDKTAVVMTGSTKMLGIFDFTVRLHPEVSAVVKVNVAQSNEEAALQADRVARGLPALSIGEEEEGKADKKADKEEAETDAKEDAKEADSRAKADKAADEAEAQATEELAAEEAVADEAEVKEAPAKKATAKKATAKKAAAKKATAKKATTKKAAAKKATAKKAAAKKSE